MLTATPQPSDAVVAATDKAFYQQLGQRIAERRKALGMNQTQLADRLGISQQTMANYEIGKLRVAIAMLPVLSDALGLPVEAIIGIGGKKLPKPGPSKRGPTPQIQRQLEAVSALPRAKQRVVSQVLDSMLAQADR